MRFDRRTADKRKLGKHLKTSHKHSIRSVNQWPPSETNVLKGIGGRAWGAPVLAQATRWPQAPGLAEPAPPGAESEHRMTPGASAPLQWRARLLAHPPTPNAQSRQRSPSPRNATLSLAASKPYVRMCLPHRPLPLTRHQKETKEASSVSFLCFPLTDTGGWEGSIFQKNQPTIKMGHAVLSSTGR
jgi:hypothetical protein